MRTSPWLDGYWHELSKGGGGRGGPSGVPQADGTVVRPKDNDTNFASKVSNKPPLVKSNFLKL